MERAERHELVARRSAPDEVEIIREHDRRIGRGLQARIAPWFAWTLSWPVWLLAPLLLRLEVDGHEHFRRKGIYALRHFYEWDGIFTVMCMVRRHALLDPWLAPYCLGGRAWVRTAPRRAFLWLTSGLALVRGDGERQVAFDRVEELLAAKDPCIVTIYPTGPMGRSHAPPVAHSGVGYLATRVPDVPVVPVSVIGMQELTLRDVLLLRRPRIRIRLGAPLFARSEDGAPRGLAVRRLCERLEAAWGELEREA